MKKLNQIIEKIEANQKAIQAFGKFSEEVLKKINYKLRLDWNYYSNRMEGGTLTQSETRSVMVGNVDVQGKPLKDVMEMHGHDKAVLDVLKMGKGEQRIAEKRIKELHKVIMHEEDPTKTNWVGQWKTEPNEIINYKNEKISFYAPADVADAMHTLVDTTNASLDRFYSGNVEIHPIEIAAKFHIDFVTIHPFYDGNGRMARILTNIILVACGYAPIIIKDDKKKSYYQLLADIQAYGGKPDLFYAFWGERLIESQTLVLSAINGDEIDEPDDLDKKLAMLEKEMLAEDEGNEIKKSIGAHVFVDIYTNWLKQLLDQLMETSNKFNKFYDKNSHNYNLFIGGKSFNSSYHMNESEFIQSLKTLKPAQIKKNANEARFTAALHAYKKGGVEPFNCFYHCVVEFKEYTYQIKMYEEGTENNLLNTSNEKKLLHQDLSQAEQNQIVKDWGESLLNHLEHNRKKLKS